MPTENRKQKTENRPHLFRLITFGCKVNQCDTAGMARELTLRGWQAAAPGAVPDLVLVNTCTVTARADQQARQAVRRLAREYPGVPLWVTGCYAQRAPAEVAALPGVQAVFGNQEKAGLAHILSNCLGNRSPEGSPSPWGGEGWGGGENPPVPGPLPPGEGEEIIFAKRSLNAGEPFKELRLWVGTFSAAAPFQPWRVHAVPGHTRAWLKIQEGCSHQCRYCIVPRVRGPRRSLEPAAVIRAFEELAALGYQEVVLTGVDLGQYGLERQPPGSLAGLVRSLRERPRPFRVRLSSLEPMMVTTELLDELAAWEDFCPHFHLPLQSGAAPILAAMGRPYGPAEFRDLVGEITRRFPGAGLGLDVLVGFPGESDADFEATRSLVATLPATYLHVFPFSPRPGTPAADLPRLPAQVIQARARNMRELGQTKKAQFLAAQRGQVREVLVEGPAAQPGWLQGLSDHYLRVIFPGPMTWRNRRVKVRFRDIKEELLLGEPLDEP
jgi:threonylcarbamoyladenosine tRNA methylthiotransferase MtaB